MAQLREGDPWAQRRFAEEALYSDLNHLFRVGSGIGAVADDQSAVAMGAAMMRFFVVAGGIFRYYTHDKRVEACD
jgi:hypothetical protein